MPPPPPPPPVPGGPRGAGAPRLPAPKGTGGGDRGALLASIRGGTNLKKTVTNDRSAPCVEGKTKPSTNGAAGGGGGGGGGGGMGMNEGAPQLAGLFSGGMPKLRPTGKGISTSPSRSGPMLPPGRKPAPTVPFRSAPSDADSSFTNNNNSIPPSPKPSSKSNPAPPPPPPANLKPTLSSGDRPNRVPMPVPPINKPAPPRPPMDDRPAPPSPNGSYHPALPSKPSVVGKPSVGNKPAPPRPQNGLKPAPPPKMALQPNGDSVSFNKSAMRTHSMREQRSNDYQNHRLMGEENVLPSRTLPPNHHRNSGGGNPAQPSIVGRYKGTNLARNMTRPPTDRPPPPPIRPSVPPPSQPPPPPPSRTPIASKPELQGSVPPPPMLPSRVSSLHSGSDFEGKFHFHTLHEFPLPIAFLDCSKTYPSKNGKNAKRPETTAPPPPPSTNLSSLAAPTRVFPNPSTQSSLPRPPNTTSPYNLLPSTPLPPPPRSSPPLPGHRDHTSSQSSSFAVNYNLRRDFQLGQSFPIHNATHQGSDA